MSTAEIEAALLQHPAVAETCVVGIKCASSFPLGYALMLLQR